MNIQETLALIEALKASGVKKFKSHEYEIEFGLSHSKASVKEAEQLPLPISSEHVKATEEANKKISELINTIKMTPEELADQIFPNGAL